ncbi:Uncharacterised protein [uncultured archaeon]|nr:Uncharacterised protein [uncultured archaeon]
MNAKIIAVATLLVLLLGCAKQQSAQNGSPDGLGNAGISIKETDSPGFIATAKTRTTTIGNDGKITVETTGYDPATSKEKTETAESSISREQLEGLASYILSTDFFGIKQADYRICNPDTPRTAIEITIGDKSNSLYGIGACNIGNLPAVSGIIEKIGSAAGRQQDTSAG